MGIPSSSEAAWIEQQSSRVDVSDCSGAGRGGVVVDQNREWNLFICCERPRVCNISGAHGDDVGSRSSDLWVGAAQLRSMLAAEQSAEVAEKCHDDRALRPEVAEPMAGTVNPTQFDLLEFDQVHGCHDATFQWMGDGCPTLTLTSG